MIDLLAGCAKPGCLKMAGELKAQLDPAYCRGASVMPLEVKAGAWLEAHRTARKRSAQAEKLGYTFATIDRQVFADDIYDINTSTDRRQGRPMSPGYQQQPVYGPNPMTCPMHHVYTYGVHDDDQLRAYLWLYRSGELAMVSSILGHADYLADGIMYLLYRGMLEEQLKLGGMVFYNLWNSGTDGLRWFKECVGLAEGDVEWTLT